MSLDPIFVHGITVLSSLGLAGLMSPELLVLGLFLAGDGRDPRLKTAAFSAGTVLGLFAAMAAGFFLAPLDLHHTPLPSWHGFFLRVALGLALIAVGISRIRQTRKVRPPATGQGSEEGEEIPAFLLKLLPIGGHAEHMSTLRAIGISGLVGILIGAISPKRLPICMAAGHLLTTFPSLAGRITGAAAFMALALIPSLLPLALVLVRPQAAALARRAVERVAARYGFWLLAGLLILLGLHLLYASLALLPASATAR